jgi:hypothetical protein
MGLKSRNKGKRGEREAAAEIRRLFRTDACRGCQFAGGEESPDIRTSIPHVHFEVKRAETVRLYDALNQAIADAGANIPVVLHKQNRHPWIAITRLDDLPQLAVQLYLTLAQNQ